MHSMHRCNGPQSPIILPMTPRSIILLLLSVPTICKAQERTWQQPPRLVVGIVVDQLRTDYIYRYWHNFGEGGFKRLVNEGAFLRDAHFNYMPTYTGPGHASIYTGATPAHHGIVGNDMYVRATGANLYCAQDDAVQGVGGEGNVGQRSPRNMLSTSIADEMERRFGGLSKTIGISWKDRGAILPIGRTGDAAYWFAAGTNGHFISSTWYMQELPKWLQDFNAQGHAQKLLRSNWDLLLPRERYQQVLPDDNPYEIPLPGAASATLPQDLQALYEAGGGQTGLLGYLPGSNTMLTDLAIAAMEGEDMGTDDIPDLLAVSYSAPDILGHRMGPRALEVEDMYLRLDLELARLFKALDERAGKGRYVVFLTADHGAVDVPEYLKDLRGSAGYADLQAIRNRLDSALVARFGQGKWVMHEINEQFFLNDALIATSKLDPATVQRAAAEVLRREPIVAEVFTATDLVGADHAGLIRSHVQRGFMAHRSGDVCVVLRPGHFDPGTYANKRGTTHGSPWNYDTHVPIIFMGTGIRKGEVLRRTHITDIAPTIAAIVGTSLPDAATGAIVTEVLVD